MALLELAGIHSFYGHVEALKGIDLAVEEGEIVTLIGANGAGKSTLLMTICGRPRAAQGSINFQGRDITRMPTYEIVRLGISPAPEGRRVFPRMSVLENLQLGAIVADPARFPVDLDRVFNLFPILRERQDQRAGTLSGGEQQMLAIGRALMSRPKLLLLDEPSLGLAPMIAKQIFEVIRAINAEEKITVLLVEQNAHHALNLAHRGYVLQTGQIILSGKGKELLANKEVRAAYLEGGAKAS
jgi:branched-chain amino acid transport system ATP-binding protein